MDDIAVVTRITNELKKAFRSMKNEAKAVGLGINED